jgi:hypothetical protein
LKRLAAEVRRRSAAKGLATTLLVRRVLPVGFRKVVERRHSVGADHDHERGLLPSLQSGSQVSYGMCLISTSPRTRTMGK